MAKLKKLPLDLPTVTVHPNGKLKGHTVIMREPSTAVYLAVRGGDMDTDASLRAVLDHVVDDSFPGGVGSLPPIQVAALLSAWMEAWQESVLPKATGTSTDEPSES